MRHSFPRRPAGKRGAAAADAGREIRVEAGHPLDLGMTMTVYRADRRSLDFDAPGDPDETPQGARGPGRTKH